MHGSHSSTPVAIKRARIEIIPLIDIMFFLLAFFIIRTKTSGSSSGRIRTPPTTP
jgi:biopolymer transport protein ExbD